MSKFSGKYKSLSTSKKRHAKGSQRWNDERKKRAKQFKKHDESDDLPVRYGWGESHRPPKKIPETKERQQRNVKRTIGKTRKYVAGTGWQVWVGKDITKTGWMLERTYKRL